MDVKIENILRNIKEPINILHTIFETVTNSFDAGATNIKITFFKNKNLDVGLKTIRSFSVEDNGEGFNKKNIDSFSEYLSSLKLKLGCKGVGRFTWLKVFKNVLIESQFQDKCINIRFDKNYNSENSITEINKKGEVPFTRVTFDGLLDFKKNTMNLDLKKIKEEIMDHFLLKFSIYKYEKRTFNITLIEENGDCEKIDLDDIIPTSKVDFPIKGKEKAKYNFSLVYNFIEDDKNMTKVYLCANNRVVEPILKEYNKVGLPNRNSAVFLIFSKYFDDRVNEERTKFVLDKSTDFETIADPITYKKIVAETKNKIDKLILKRYPEINEENDITIRDCINEYPYLSKYLSEDKSVIKRKDRMLKQAEQKYRKEKADAKLEFSNMIKSNNLDVAVFEEMIDKLSDISNRELAQYFIYRQQIIDGLRKLDDNDEALEALLHNLFMRKGLSRSKEESNNSYSNNIWLLDDKFMSYSNIFSDKRVDTILKQIATHNNVDAVVRERPDMTIFYSNNSVVIVEFKGIGVKYQDKLNAIPEINRNLGIVAKNIEGTHSIYGFIITGFTKDFEEHLEAQTGVRKMFTNSTDPLYYYYNENITDKDRNKVPSHVFITSTKTIWKDANERNKLFIDIIKNN